MPVSQGQMEQMREYRFLLMRRDGLLRAAAEIDQILERDKDNPLLKTATEVYEKYDQPKKKY